jgi:AAA ATPase domain
VDQGASTADFHPSTTPFVGRAHERSELRCALEAALGGSGRVVLVGGEPGIGKTHLAAVIAGEAVSGGVPVWWGRGWEDGTAPVFWPWNVALRRWMQHAGDEGVRRAAGDLAPELAHVFPVLREHMPGLPEVQEWESDQARFRLFDAVSRFLGAVALPAGLMVVLDDVHWADGASLKLLEFVAADLRHARLLLVATYRDTEVRRGHPFRAALASLAREPCTRRLTLPGLSASDCARYATLTGAGVAADALGAELHRETNGNPFFLGEIVRLLASEGRLGVAWDPRFVPPGVREVIARRLDRLGEDCRAALAVGALLGETFDAERLENVLAAASRPVEPVLADLLSRAVRDRILVETEGSRYGFAHALIRRVLIDEVEPSERAAWHARIAAALECGAESRVDDIAAELARHFGAAGTPDGLHKGFAYACRGAERAARGLGWEEAARLYQIALDVGERCGALDTAGTIELRLALARALRRSGDVAGARARCREAAIACREAHRPDLLGRAALIHAGPVGDFYRTDPDARAFLEEACRAGRGLDDSLRARLYGRLAGDIIAANEIDQINRAAVLADEAASAARRAGDSGALAQALLASFYLAALGTRPPADAAYIIVPPTLPTLQDILEAAESAGELEFAAGIRHTRAAAMFALGEAEGYWAEHDALATVAEASRVPEALWLADAIAAMRATVEGRFAEGQRLSEQALATGLRMQLANAAGVHLGQQVMWHAVQGRLAELLPLLRAFLERHPRVVAWRAFLALARLAGGDEVGARAEFRSLVAAGFTPAKRGVNLRSCLAGLAALCVGLRDREQAPVLYDLVARRPEAWVVDGCATFGPWALALGALAHLCGRQADAAAHFEEAIHLGRRMRSRPVVAHAQSLLAAVWLSGDPDAETRARALETLAEAEQTARELGIVDVQARAERLRATLPSGGEALGNALRRDGDFWTVRYAGRSLQLKEGKGLHYLAALLAAPGREFHVLQLAAAAAPATFPAAGAVAGLSVGAPGMPLDDRPDTRARHEYGARLDDLRTELDEAERLGDLGRAERLRVEVEALMAELSARFGRTRSRSPAETARKAVTKALRTQIGKLLDSHPPLGRHLRDAVRMGTICVYAPSTPVHWEVGFG